MPRLRLLAKILLGILGFVVVFKVMNTKPLEPTPAPAPIEPVEEPLPPSAEPEPVLTEFELIEQSMEAAKRQDWVWKDFPT